MRRFFVGLETRLPGWGGRIRTSASGNLRPAGFSAVGRSCPPPAGTPAHHLLPLFASHGCGRPNRASFFDAEVRVLPPQPPVRLQRVTYEGRSKTARTAIRRGDRNCLRDAPAESGAASGALAHERQKLNNATVRVARRRPEKTSIRSVGTLSDSRDG